MVIGTFDGNLFGRSGESAQLEAWKYVLCTLSSHLIVELTMQEAKNLMAERNALKEMHRYCIVLS
jgi:hypothetical protein